jgi:(p)ppGpp synthase/HD superfamily hydrolase
MNQELANKALVFAVNAHSGQFDKAGFPYILHPIRVSEAFNEETMKCVAILHDVVEDTDTTIQQIKDEFGEKVGTAVCCLTKRTKSGYTEPYREYLDRVKHNYTAHQVKLQDMRDNSSIKRTASLSIEKRLRLLAKYARGRHYLLNHIWYEDEHLDHVIRAGYKK